MIKATRVKAASRSRCCYQTYEGARGGRCCRGCSLSVSDISPNTTTCLDEEVDGLGGLVYASLMIEV